MSQPALFVESMTDAIREVVRACGGTKVVASRLWPEKAPEAAARILLDCLNESRAEKLSPDQVLMLARMGRERGCHAVMAFYAAECGYSAPVPIEPEDERAQLQREYVEAVKALSALTHRLDRVDASVVANVSSIGRAR